MVNMVLISGNYLIYIHSFIFIFDLFTFYCIYLYFKVAKGQKCHCLEYHHKKDKSFNVIIHNKTLILITIIIINNFNKTLKHLLYINV